MVTVFSGGPAAVWSLPDWDRDCGVFDAGDDVAGIRRGEDTRAADLLKASIRHLNFWDGEYRSSAYGYQGATGAGELAEAVARELEHLIDELSPSRWLIPLGVLHPDHQITADACMTLANGRPDVEWLVYEELPYAEEFSGERDLANEHVRNRGFATEPLDDVREGDGNPPKQMVIGCYASQLHGLGHRANWAIAAPERVHRLCRIER